jgi:SP family myo-inositol transporter-like MFS transporter 13
MYYGPDILITAGLSIPGMDQDESALLLNIPLASVNAIGTLISCIYIDKAGRRYLMLRTLPFSVIGWLITALGMYMNGYTDAKTTGSYVAFVGIILFLFSFSIGMSSTPWTVNAEIYPLHVIGTANSLSTTTNWLTNFVVATVFLIFLSTPLGSVLSFIVLAIFAVLAWVFIYFLLPETANRTIDEILVAILGSNYQNEKYTHKPE